MGPGLFRGPGLFYVCLCSFVIDYSVIDDCLAILSPNIAKKRHGFIMKLLKKEKHERVGGAL